MKPMLKIFILLQRLWPNFKHGIDPPTYLLQPFESVHDFEDEESGEDEKREHLDCPHNLRSHLNQLFRVFLPLCESWNAINVYLPTTQD
jgi:hypothetical protein